MMVFIEKEVASADLVKNIQTEKEYNYAEL